MKTYGKEYGKFVVTFNNSNEYIEMGSLDNNPGFGGILIREKFSNKIVELFPDQIKFFLEELRNLDTGNKEENPIVKMIHKYGWNKCHSDILLVISDYDGIKCRFFLGISHQYNLSFLAIETNSPEFSLEQILNILEDSNVHIEEN